MTKSHLLGVARVRRSLMFPIIVFTLLNAAMRVRHLDDLWTATAYVLFDGAMWIGVAFLIFAVIERRQKMRPQPRIAAMAAATLGISGLTTTIITVRALFTSILHHEAFVPQWLAYLPEGFYAAAFYVAIVTGIGYGVYSWAVEDQQSAETAELDAAVARAELKAASARLQPELLDAALAQASMLMTTNAAHAQHLIADLGASLHDSLADSNVNLPSRRALVPARAHFSPTSSDTTARDSRRAPARAPGRRSG